MTLIRVDRTTRNGKPTHHYELDGNRVDGVTTVLSGGVPKPWLPGWAARTVAEHAINNWREIDAMRATGGDGPTIQYLKAIPWQKRDEAAVRGTQVHALAEQLIMGEQVDVPEHLYRHVDGYAAWLDLSGVTPVLTEFVVGSRQHGYAGTADLILRDHTGRLRIADIKTSKGVYGETALQLAAYRFAEFYLNPATGSEEVPYTVDDVGWVLHVTAEGTNAYRVPVDETQFEAFLAAQQVARWAKKSRDLVGTGVSLPGKEQ
jgi:hypothetical protein